MTDLQALRIAEVASAGDNQKRRWLYNQAWAMRLAPTKAEADMRAILETEGYEYVPQYVIGRYIVDFYLPSLNLVIEVDGSAHFGQEKRDAIRQVRIEAQGFDFIRYTNQDVIAWRNMHREDWPEPE